MKENNKILQMLLVIVGTLIFAASVNLFILPNNLSTGGASGIAIIFYYVYQFPVGIVVLILNLPLFAVALKDLGLKFCSKAILGTVLLAIFIEVTSNISKYISIPQDIFLGAIFGGFLNGIGLSLVFKGGASTGGSDLLAQIIYKKRRLSSIGQLLLIIDAAVIGANIIVFKSINTALYSIIALYITKKTTDIIFEGVNNTKAVNIITKKGEEISKQIIAKTDRGVTISKCVGMYTNEEYMHIICVVTVSELAKIKQIVKSIDSTAFMYISNTSEVLGLGFKENE